MTQSETLAKRLQVGWERCNAAPALSPERSRLEDFWIELLHEYEAAVETERTAANAARQPHLVGSQK